jgi:hypothetical protein
MAKTRMRPARTWRRRRAGAAARGNSVNAAAHRWHTRTSANARGALPRAGGVAADRRLVAAYVSRIACATRRQAKNQDGACGCRVRCLRRTLRPHLCISLISTLPATPACLSVISACNLLSSGSASFPTRRSRRGAGKSRLPPGMLREGESDDGRRQAAESSLWWSLPVSLSAVLPPPPPAYWRAGLSAWLGVGLKRRAWRWFGVRLTTLIPMFGMGSLSLRTLV